MNIDIILKINEIINNKYSIITNNLKAFDKSGSFNNPNFNPRNNNTHTDISEIDKQKLAKASPSFLFVI